MEYSYESNKYIFQPGDYSVKAATRINAIISFFDPHSIKQRSEKWFAMRRKTIGSSEMSALLGLNPYTSFKQLKRRKVVQSKFKNIATIFGVLLEPLSLQYLTKNYGQIWTLGSCRHPTLPVAASPDGIGTGEHNREVFLWEIKCPIWSVRDEVPKYYLPQVQTAMGIIPVDYCLFADCYWRVCSQQDWDTTPNYNKWFHREHGKEIWGDPIAYAVVWVLAKEWVSKENDPRFLDFGTRGFAKLVKHNFDYYYEGLSVKPKSLFKPKEFEKTDGRKVVGLLCLKLMRANVVKIEREPFLQQNIIQITRNIKEILRDISMFDAQERRV